MDYTIKDSSYHRDPIQYAAHDAKDTAIKLGTVREIYQSTSTEIKYIVEACFSGITIPVACSLMTRWGGIQNYEEYGLRSYKGSTSTDAGRASDFTFDTRVGDVVLIACLQGHYREGVILGGIRHPARKTILESGDIAYVSQFNGIETKITNEGAYRVTNKAKKPFCLTLIPEPKVIELLV